ncbi:MAG: NADH-quinone oxidoreductase subunit J family protein [Thermogutta sp.]
MDTRTTTMILATIFVAGGLWWALPWGKQRRRASGWVMLGVGLAMIAALIPPVGSLLARLVITLMAIVTVASAAAMVTTRRPLSAALWFGMAVLGTAGMLLYNGSQFAAMAIIVIYIGAILVMFLFLLMLDNPKGIASFDRESWEPLTAAIVGALLISLTTATWLYNMPGNAHAADAEQAGKVAQGIVVTQTVELGNELFSRYGVAVQVLGVMLLLALVGAAIMIARPLEPLSDFRDRGETTQGIGPTDSVA